VLDFPGKKFEGLGETRKEKGREEMTRGKSRERGDGSQEQGRIGKKGFRRGVKRREGAAGWNRPTQGKGSKKGGGKSRIAPTISNLTEKRKQQRSQTFRIAELKFGVSSYDCWRGEEKLPLGYFWKKNRKTKKVRRKPDKGVPRILDQHLIGEKKNVQRGSEATETI